MGLKGITNVTLYWAEGDEYVLKGWVGVCVCVCSVTAVFLKLKGRKKSFLSTDRCLGLCQAFGFHIISSPSISFDPPLYVCALRLAGLENLPD